jgi:tetratricopeptide (TPR) repeat protein
MRIDPTGWALGFTGCFIDWLITRQWRRILFGFIPLIVAISVGGLVAWGSRLDRDQLADRYLELANSEVEAWEKQWAPDASGSAEPDKSKDAGTAAATAARAAEIPRFAETLFRRVQQLHTDDQRSVFFIAMTLAQRGSVPLAVARLESIAPKDREGYLPAHAMLAEIFLSRGRITPQDLPVVKHHARAALRWNRTSPQLLIRIGELFRQTGENDLAVRAVAAAADRDAKFYLPLAKLTAQSSKWLLQHEDALPKAESYFREQVALNPQDVEARLLLADALLVKRDFAQAEQVVIEGLKESDDPKLRYALSEIYRSQFVATSKLTGTTWSGEIELLDRAFRIDPTNNKVFEEVAKLARISGTAPSDELMAQLRKLLAEGKATSVTHMWIAEYYLLTDKMAQAIPHLETAVKRDPRAARCWNNLAFSLATLYPDRLEEALKCADRAIDLVSGVADFHDTRGVVLVAMGRHGDAIVEFERAVELAARAPRDNPSNPAYHDRLATSYEALGDKPMADEHRRIAAEERLQAEKQAQQESVASEAAPTKAASTEAAFTEAVSTEAASTEMKTSESATTEPAATEPETTDEVKPVPEEPAPPENPAPENPPASEDPGPEDPAPEKSTPPTEVGEAEGAQEKPVGRSERAEPGASEPS